MKHEDFFGQAKWLEAEDVVRMPIFRKTFETGKVKKATINIIGLGTFVGFLNGKRISQDLFAPLNSDYHKRKMLVNGYPFDEELNYRMYVCQYDVTELLREGKNVLGVKLGPAWYANYEWDAYGRMKLCFRLTIEDENGVHEVLSDETVKCRKSHVVDCDMNRGEKQRHYAYPDGWMDPDYDDSYWNDVVVVKTPDTNFYLQDCPADREIRSIEPKLIYENGNIRRYDCGENISGYVVLKGIQGVYGDVTVVMSEELLPDGTLDMYRSFEQAVSYSVNLTYKPEYKPYFTWQAFRYFEVQGRALDVDRVVVVHADVEVTSTFESSEPVLNWLNDAYIRTQLCNMHMGIPSDCPHVERRGYTGDGQLTCETAMLMLDGKKFYKKWIADISDCQDRKTGHVQYTAPFISSGGGPGGWGCAIVVVPYAYYKIYGDAEPMTEMFDQMLHYLDYLYDHSENDLVTSDRPNAWCLGDWCVAEKPIAIPEAYVNTYFFVKSIDNILEIADIIGRTDCRERLLKLRESRCEAIMRTYFDAETGNFAGNYQASNAFALDIGLGDERTMTNMVNYYESYGMYDCGIFGTEILTRILFERGHSELAYRLLTSKGKYSFHNWMEQGATTIWEYWHGLRSHSHPMFGAVCRYLYQHILGIQQETAGFEKIQIRPACIPALDNAKGSVMTPVGRVSVERRNNGDKICFVVELPEGTTADFMYGKTEKKLSAGRNEISLSL